MEAWIALWKWEGTSEYEVYTSKAGGGGGEGSRDTTEQRQIVMFIEYLRVHA